MPVDVAEPPAAYVSSIAAAVNNPWSWQTDFEYSFGASVGVGINEHLVIRGNVAHYRQRSSTLGLLTNLALGGDGGEGGIRRGNVFDAGVSAMYFPRRAWDGFLVDAGVLYRRHDHSEDDDFRSPEYVLTQTQSLGARAQVGWSWRYGPVFLAIALGASASREWGHEIIDGSIDRDMPMTVSVGRMDLEGEGMFRIGAVYDL